MSLADALGIAGSLVVASSVAHALFVAIGTALAPWARIAVEKATLGTGPRLFTVAIRGTPVEVRLLPLSASLTPLGATPIAEGEQAPAPPPPPIALWYDAPPWRRAALMVLLPRLSSFLLASLLVGPARAARSLAHGVLELFQGATAPLSVGRSLLDDGARVLHQEGFAALSALALCKLLAAGALALPGDLSFALARQPRHPVIAARIALMLVGLALSVSWVVSFSSWALRSG